MLLNNKRVDENVPEPPVFYEAYLYLWSVWIEELNDWKYYGGKFFFCYNSCTKKIGCRLHR